MPSKSVKHLRATAPEAVAQGCPCCARSVCCASLSLSALCQICAASSLSCCAPWTMSPSSFPFLFYLYSSSGEFYCCHSSGNNKNNNTNITHIHTCKYIYTHTQTVTQTHTYTHTCTTCVHMYVCTNNNNKK